MSGDDGAPAPSGDDPSLYPRLVVRTTLLVLSVVLLFPAALDGLTHGAWPRLVSAMGMWKWAAWAACFVGMTLMRFAGGPKRD
jgi:hypothetical protein